jgi:Tfp pilus assembly protein PilF
VEPRDEPRFDDDRSFEGDGRTPAQAAPPAPAAQAMETQKRRESGPPRVPAQETPRESMAADAAAPAEPLQAKEEGAQPAPEVLIARARTAVAAGNEAEARRWVAELRRLHPETPMPEDLRRFEARGE